MIFMKLKYFIMIFAFVVLLTNSCFAQNYGERITQEDFAVDLVKAMDLEGWLPDAALASDCADLLERLGISPLTGWEKGAYLSHEDYLVLLNKAYGKEEVVHEKATLVQHKMIQEIDHKWQISYDDLGQWLSLDELFNNKKYFPHGPLVSPYGINFQDANGNHKIDKSQPAVVSLIKLKNMISGYDANLP